jgi:O-acetyl-ADP-ribose deacetylase (regulator of RNase III)
MPVPLMNGGYVINCYTQIYLGHPNTTDDTVEARLNAIKFSLLALSRLFPRKRKIAIPKIGCGLAGLSWTDVEPLIPENITVCQI